MDDFVINVRQIAQYPQAQPAAADLVLVQKGGLGGSYVSSRVTDLVFGGLNGNFLSVPAVELPAQGSLLWNNTASLQFSPPAGWSLNYITGEFSTALFSFNIDGSAQLPFGTVKVARDPNEPFEVATANYVTNNTVASFNGRNGAVSLTSADIDTALCLDPNDPIATQSWVNGVICASIPDFINQNPFVFTFNGRVGDITLTATDVNQALFADPLNATAPSPALGDASKRIATTAFVDESLDEWAQIINTSWNQADFELLNILQTQYAPLNSPALTGIPTAPMPPSVSSDATIATTAWVMARLVASVTGVVSFNARTGAVVFDAQDLQSVGGAFINSPAFTGSPTVPMPAGGNNSNQIASTAWVLSEISAISAGVTSWNGKSGIVTMDAADITSAGGALLASPTFTGTPAGPTAAPGTNSTQLATTAFVAAAVGNSVTTFNGRSGAVSLQLNDITAAGGAPLASPAFTANPTAPTQVPGTNNTTLATTAFVVNALTGAAVVSSFNTRTGAVTLTTADITGAGGAPIASPALTGVPTAPTAAIGTSTTQVATTAFVQQSFLTSARGFVNVLANGTMTIWQRGTSGSVTNSQAWTADRWLLTVSVPAVTWQMAPGPSLLGGKALTLSATSAASAQLAQRIESVVAKMLYTDATVPPILVQFALQNTGVAQNVTVQLATASAGDNFGSTPVIGSYIFSVPAGSNNVYACVIQPSADFYNGLLLNFIFSGLTNVTINNIDLRAAPGAAPGPVTNPPLPERRTVEAELQFCQRYYQVGAFTHGWPTFTASAISVAWYFATQMRTSPTMAFSDSGQNSGWNFSRLDPLTPQSAVIVGNSQGALYVGMFFYLYATAEL